MKLSPGLKTDVDNAPLTFQKEKQLQNKTETNKQKKPALYHKLPILNEWKQTTVSS